MTTTIRSATVSGGIRLPYVESGHADGVPVLLLHGYTDSLHSFDLLRPHLPAGLRAIAPSQRGHGDADRPDDGYDGPSHAADAVAVLDLIGVHRAIIVGHSMGSQVALRLALDHPGRVLGVVLLGGFATLRDNPVVGALRDEVSKLTDPVPWAFAEEFQRSTATRPVPGDFMALAVRESLKLPAGIWRAALHGQMETDLQPELSRVAVPTQLLWGDQDAIIPRAMQETLLAGIPQARLTVLPGTGHAPHWEDPPRTAREIAAFARRVTAAGRLAA